MGYLFSGGIMTILMVIIVMVIRVALVVLVIYAIVKAIEYFRSNTNSSYDSSLEILKRRYARGEITLEEYERMKEALRY